jgi:hypothetical protein
MGQHVSADVQGRTHMTFPLLQAASPVATHVLPMTTIGSKPLASPGVKGHNLPQHQVYVALQQAECNHIGNPNHGPVCHWMFRFCF